MNVMRTTVATVVAATLSMSAFSAFAAASLTGAGATFPAPVYAKWADTYQKETGNKVNYQGIGSSGGVKQIIANTVDFGASDAPLADDKLTQEGLFQHFKAIAEHTDLPQILYNVPSRTGCDMLPETVGRLAQIKNIVGIKEATGNLSRVHQIKELVSDDFILLSGDDATGMDFMQLGGVGVISVTANVAAREMADMCRLALAGQFAEARAINQRLMPLHTKLFVEPNPIPVKWGCKALGLVATDTLRLPMTPITDQGREAVTAALKHAGLL